MSTKKAFSCDRQGCEALCAIADFSLECPDKWSAVRLLKWTGEYDRKNKLVYADVKGVLCPEHTIEMQEHYSLTNEARKLGEVEMREGLDAKAEIDIEIAKEQSRRQAAHAEKLGASPDPS